MSDDGNWFASVFSDGSIGVRQTQTGTLFAKIGQPPGGEPLSFTLSADGRLVAAASKAGVVLWNLSSGQSLQSWSSPLTESAGVTRVRFDVNGHLLAGWVWNSAPSVSLWDTSTGQQRTSLLGQVPISDVAFAPDGVQIATIDANGSVRIWRADNSQVVSDATQLASSDNTSNQLTFSEDGRTLAASAGRMVYLWKVDTLVPPPLTASAAPVGTTSAPVDAVSNGAVVASMPKVTDAQPVAAPSKAEVTASALVGKAGKLGVAASNTDSTATSVDARTSPNLQNSAELPGDSSILPNVPNSGVASKSANVANSAEVTNPVNTPDSTEASNAVNIPNTPEIQNGRVAASDAAAETSSAAASSPAIDRLPPDVVVLYLDDAQKASASRIGEYLQTSRDSEVTVRHFDHVTWKFSSPVELHYFHADDQPEAHRIVSDLRRNNVAVTARYMPVSDEIPENYFEVWLRPSASDANDNPPDLSPEIQGGKVLEPQTRFLK